MFDRLDRIEAKLERRYIGVSEAASILGVSEREVQRRARDGRLRAIPNSRPYRFLESDVIGGGRG